MEATRVMKKATITSVTNSGMGKSYIGIDATSYFKQSRQVLRAPIGGGLKVVDHDGSKELTSNGFISCLQSYYPHVLAWKILETLPDRRDSMFVLDYFAGNITKTWRQIENENTTVYPSGEYCNPLSSSTVVSKYVNDFLHLGWMKLEPGSVSRVSEPFDVEMTHTITLSMQNHQWLSSRMNLQCDLCFSSIYFRTHDKICLLFNSYENL